MPDKGNEELVKEDESVAGEQDPERDEALEGQGGVAMAGSHRPQADPQLKPWSASWWYAYVGGVDGWYGIARGALCASAAVSVEMAISAEGQMRCGSMGRGWERLCVFLD